MIEGHIKEKSVPKKNIDGRVNISCGKTILYLNAGFFSLYLHFLSTTGVFCRASSGAAYKEERKKEPLLERILS